MPYPGSPFNGVTTGKDIAIDAQNNIWVTEMTKTGFLDKVDPYTLKVTKYIPPSRDRPRRVQVDADGIVWFCVFEDGKIDRFDPKTETFKEFPLPNAKSHPYALGIAADRSLWYSSESRDVIGRLDPDSGKDFVDVVLDQAEALLDSSEAVAEEAK